MNSKRYVMKSGVDVIPLWKQCEGAQFFHGNRVPHTHVLALIAGNIQMVCKANLKDVTNANQ